MLLHRCQILRPTYMILPQHTMHTDKGLLTKIYFCRQITSSLNTKCNTLTLLALILVFIQSILMTSNISSRYSSKSGAFALELHENNEKTFPLYYEHKQLLSIFNSLTRHRCWSRRETDKPLYYLIHLIGFML